jgi:hypothetical protein
MEREAAVAASVASGAAASGALAAAWGQPIPGYGRLGGGVRPDHPAPSGRPPVPHVALAPNRARSLCLALLAVIARIAYIAAEVALVAAPSL